MLVFCSRFTEQGSSLLEVITTLAITLLLLGTAIPEFSQWRSSILRQQGRELAEQSIMLTRNEALRAGARGIISTSLNGSTLLIGVDYPPYNTPAREDSTLRCLTLPSGISLKSPGAVSINSQGQVIDQYGNLASISFDLKQHGKTYCNGTITPLAQVNIDCS